MAGTKTSDYAVDTDKWTEMLATIEKQRKGYLGLSLTNYGNNNLPAIAAGSYIEAVGALYGFSSEEAIGGSATTGNVNYIVFDPTPITLAWSLVAPTWSDSKNGWYDAGEAKRYVAGCRFDTPNYTGKWVYDEARDVKGLSKGRGLLGLAGIHIGNNTRAAAGNQVITGVGFEPSVIIFLASEGDTPSNRGSVGYDDGTNRGVLLITTLAGFTIMQTTQSVWIIIDITNSLKGLVSAKGSDGFTITWVIDGTCDIDFSYLCFP